jgi:hypothetical protein
MATQQLTPQQQQQQAQAANLAARAQVLAQSINMSQPIQTQTVNPAQNNPIVFTPRPVGLVKSFTLVLTATIANNDAALDLALTNIGLANLLSPNQQGVIFTDLNNNQRIATGGWHLSMLNSIKQRKPFASGFLVETDTMGGYGETYPILNSPSAINHGTTATVRAVYEIPVSYSEDDLRGAIYANVVNASMQLQFQINPNAFSAAGADSTFAVYKGTTDAVITSVTATLYQNYLDQLPYGKNGVVLPLIDLGTVYELKNTNVGSIAANNDYPYQYSNFRDFLSTLMIYNHDTSGDSGRTVGTDINYWALQSANFTNLWKKYPLDLSLQTRQILGCDLPLGAYYASSRRKPISSVQYGNIELVLNASTATANAQLYIGLEDFSYPNTITGAGSLAG